MLELALTHRAHPRARPRALRLNTFPGGDALPAAWGRELRVHFASPEAAVPFVRVHAEQITKAWSTLSDPGRAALERQLGCMTPDAFARLCTQPLAVDAPWYGLSLQEHGAEPREEALGSLCLFVGKAPETLPEGYCRAKPLALGSFRAFRWGWASVRIGNPPRVDPRAGGKAILEAPSLHPPCPDPNPDAFPPGWTSGRTAKNSPCT